MGFSGLPKRRTALGVAVVLTALATFPYLPFFALPHISDDYVQIELGRKYGAISGWRDLASDALYRCRATSILLTNWTVQLFGSSSALFHAESTLLHALNTLLIAGLGSWSLIGWRLAAVAAGFFAIYEGHQEAVVWYAAVPELLVFFFALLALHAWLRWLHAADRRLGHVFYGSVLVLFLLALLSKESAVAAVPLMAGAAHWFRKPFRSIMLALAPHAVLSAVYAVAIFAAQETHLHLNDGTFSLTSPVAAVMARSIFRLLWVWGLLALLFLATKRLAEPRLLAGVATWMLVTLLPYAFLSYMPRVPSRHVYWSSVGLAFLVARAMIALWDSGSRPRVLAAVAVAVIVFHNCAYLWTKKYPHYQRRAEPTEKLVRFSEGVPGPIIVKCFPYRPEVALLAVQIRANRAAETAVWNPDAPAGDGVYCDAEQP